MNQSIAIVDIGSNTVRFAVVQRTADGFFNCPQGKTLTTTRLGSGLLATGLLQEETMEKSIEAAASYASLAHKESLPVFAYATSAVRDAKNKDDFLHRLNEAAGLSCRVLSGQEEGRLAYRGAAQKGGSLLDIGGGSVQLVTDSECFSFPTGCVRGKDVCQSGTLKEMQVKLYSWLSAQARIPLMPSPPFMGAGGTITTLGALLLGQKEYNGAALADSRITKAALRAVLQHLYVMGDDRKKHPLLLERHDVILQGGIILLYFMEKCGIKSLTPTDRDGMEGFASLLFAEGKAF